MVQLGFLRDPLVSLVLLAFLTPLYRQQTLGNHKGHEGTTKEVREAKAPGSPPVKKADCQIAPLPKDRTAGDAEDGGGKVADRRSAVRPRIFPEYCRKLRAFLVGVIK